MKKVWKRERYQSIMIKRKSKKKQMSLTMGELMTEQVVLAFLDKASVFHCRLKLHFVVEQIRALAFARKD